MKEKFDHLWVGRPYLSMFPCFECGVKSVVCFHIVDMKRRITLSLQFCECGFSYRSSDRTREEHFRDAPLTVEPYPEPPKKADLETQILQIMLKLFKRLE